MNGPRENYRSVLKRELEKRVKKNSRYSLRAFARSLALDPRHLDGVLKGIKGLSSEKAMEVADRLGFAANAKSYFLESVRAEDSRGRKDRMSAQVQLESLFTTGILKKLEVEMEQVELVSDYIGIAVHEYVKSHPMVNLKQICQAFNEDKDRIEPALRCLQSLGLVRQLAGKYSAKDVNVFSSDEIPSPALRNGHRSLLRKAEKSLEENQIQERDFFSLLMNIDPKDLPEAKLSIRQFLNRFNHQFSKDQSHSEVMSLALQLIPLTQPIQPKKQGEQK